MAAYAINSGRSTGRVRIDLSAMVMIMAVEISNVAVGTGAPVA